MSTDLLSSKAQNAKWMNCRLVTRRSALEELAARGIDAAMRLPAMSSLGYREISAVARGHITLDEALTRIKHETCRFIRAQDAWFRKINQF